MRAAGRSRFAPKIGHHREPSSGARLDRRRVVLEVSVADNREPCSSDVSRFSAVGLVRMRLTIWMQNIGTPQARRRLPRLLRLSTVAQGRGCALGLLYF
jgi:hypothetical protein